MKYEITNNCIMCGTCEALCPVHAISEATDMYRIDLELCTDCGTCQKACPVKAVAFLDNV